MITSETDELAALRAENQELKARLEESGELLRVVRAGEVATLNRIQEAEQARAQAEQCNEEIMVTGWDDENHP